MARCQPIPYTGRRRLDDLTGQRFGKLFIVGFAGFSTCCHRRSEWHAICRCGRSCVVKSAAVKRGSTASCGCRRGLTSTELITANIAVDPITACWNWNAKLRPDGYAHLRIHSKRVLAHRLSYETFIGPIPDGVLVLHKCDNPSCVCPDHLFLGSHQDNKNDSVRKGRHKKLLTHDTVREIRRLSSEGMQGVDIATRFGISSGTVYDVLHRKRWGYVV